MTSIGQTLAQARRDRKVTVKDVEKAIKIRAKYISALEKDDFEQISGDAYVVGFIKTYAQWLAIDPESLIAQYRVEARFAVKAPLSDLNFDSPERAGTVTAVKIGIVVLVLLLLAVVLIVLPAVGGR